MMYQRWNIRHFLAAILSSARWNEWIRCPNFGFRFSISSNLRFDSTEFFSVALLLWFTTDRIVFARNRLLALWYGCDRWQLLGPYSSINFDVFSESCTISFTACLSNQQVHWKSVGDWTSYANYLVNVSCDELPSRVFGETMEVFPVFELFATFLCFDFNFLYKFWAIRCCCSDLDLFSSDIFRQPRHFTPWLFTFARVLFWQIKSVVECENLTFAMLNGSFCQTSHAYASVCVLVQMPDKRKAAFDQVKSTEVRKLWEIFVAISIAHSIRNNTDERYFWTRRN